MKEAGYVMKTVQDKLNELRLMMKDKGITVYVIPTSDYHESEYINDYFKCREYMSGFTGSAGTMIVTQTRAVLYTDGRYFIQAEKELAGTGIQLMRTGEKDVISQEEYIRQNVNDGSIGFDGKVVAASYANKFSADHNIICNSDLVGRIWDGRPSLIGKWAFVLDKRYAGETSKDKLARVRQQMSQYNAKYYVLTSLDDIAWIYNIRGNDIAYNPVVMSYTIIGMYGGTIYLHKAAITQEIEEYFRTINIKIKAYNEFYEDLSLLDDKVLLEMDKINYTAYLKINKDRILNKENPTTLMKSIKNSTEIENLKKAHVMDGVAVTRFMYWLKNEVSIRNDISELSAAEKLEEFRKEYDSYIEPSFETISAYGPNGAMMHYSADKDSNALLKQGDFLLVDSGGQYFEGTTDVTRTFALGEISEEARKHFTLVAKSMLSLANARFLYGCKGMNLDILARGPLWNIGIDYKCGTGHGVGYLLNVHEAPNGFRWKSVPQRSDGCVLEPGMVTTDEPGVYLEGKYGIRTENELLCVTNGENEYGTFLKFEQLTMVPIDLDAINVEYLDKTDIQNLNNYHVMVYNTIAPFLNDDEKNWLKEYTRTL